MQVLKLLPALAQLRRLVRLRARVRVRVRVSFRVRVNTATTAGLIARGSSLSSPGFEPVTSGVRALRGAPRCRCGVTCAAPLPPPAA